MEPENLLATGFLPWSLGVTSITDNLAVTVFSGGINTYYRIPTYAFKHFSRYIRPGAVRLNCTPDNPNGISVSAFRHTGNNTLTIVLVNKGGTANIIIPSTPSISTFDVYKSQSGSYWQHSTASVSNNVVSVSVPGNGIVTLYGVGGGVVPTPTPSSNSGFKKLKNYYINYAVVIQQD